MDKQERYCYSFFWAFYFFGVLILAVLESLLFNYTLASKLFPDFIMGSSAGLFMLSSIFGVLLKIKSQNRFLHSFNRHYITLISLLLIVSYLINIQLDFVSFFTNAALFDMLSFLFILVLPFAVILLMKWNELIRIHVPNKLKNILLIAVNIIIFGLFIVNEINPNIFPMILVMTIPIVFYFIYAMEAIGFVFGILKKKEKFLSKDNLRIIFAWAFPFFLSLIWYSQPTLKFFIHNYWIPVEEVREQLITQWKMGRGIEDTKNIIEQRNLDKIIFDDKSTILFDLIELNRDQLIKNYLEEFSPELDVFNSEGDSPLYIAQWKNDKTIYQVLLNAGADKDLGFPGIILKHGKVEKIYKYLEYLDLVDLSQNQLRQLNKFILAKNGYKFRSQSDFDFFSQYEWYKPNGKYTDPVRLSEQDRNLLLLIWITECALDAPSPAGTTLEYIEEEGRIGKETPIRVSIHSNKTFSYQLGDFTLREGQWENENGAIKFKYNKNISKTLVFTYDQKEYSVPIFTMHFEYVDPEIPFRHFIDTTGYFAYPQIVEWEGYDDLPWREYELPDDEYFGWAPLWAITTKKFYNPPAEITPFISSEVDTASEYYMPYNFGEGAELLEAYSVETSHLFINEKAFKPPSWEKSVSLHDIEASSYLTESFDINKYHPVKAFDGKEDTGWLEKHPEAGLGESLSCTFKDPITANGIKIMPGYFDERYWEQNNRVKKVKVILDDFEMSAIFQDERKIQWIDLRRPITFQKASFIIEEVYPSTKWNDTGISEISFHYFSNQIPVDLQDFENYLKVAPE